MSEEKFYLRERHNPQFEKPYYVREGQRPLSYKMKVESGEGYGYNVMLPFDTEKEYNEMIEKLKADGFYFAE